MMRIAAAFGLALGLVAPTALAQQGQPVDFSKLEIRTTRLADNIYVYEAAPNIGNVISLSGPDGVLLVDTMNVPLHGKLLAAIRATGATGPIRYVINTHLHGDHTAGNELFAKDGAAIVAHDNELKRMMAPKADGTPSAPAALWPSVTYSDHLTLRFDGEEVQLIHAPPAHTDGDTIVYFKRANVMDVGDLPSSIRYPVIGIDDGGGVDGMIAGGKFVMGLANAQTKLISAHTGPLVTFKEVTIQDGMLQTVRDRIAKMISAGRSLQQVVDAKPTKDFDEGRLGGSSTPDRFVTTVYTDLARRMGKAK